MKDKHNKNQRLGLRFHQTFIPERHYISALLRFVENGGKGTNAEISDKTGIPTGKSSGKVPSIIKYCKSMGLIEIHGIGSSRALKLTDFGKSVFNKDPNLGKGITQLMAHLHLCRRIGGSETWFLLFAKGDEKLGNDFSRNQLEDFLAGFFGRSKRSLIGPLIRTYEDPAALKTAGVLIINKHSILRKPVPLLRDFQYGFAAFLLELWENHFPETYQTTFTDFESETFWGTIHSWSDRRKEQALNLIRETGAIEIDKQMHPWVLTKTADSGVYWGHLYKEG